jgi:SAM-dependent methyltransferase
MSDRPSPLIDVALARRNLARSRAMRSSFLAETVGEEIGQRLELINRTFALALVHGLASSETVERLKSTGRFGRIIRAASCFEPAAELIFDSEALPIAAETLDCMVSVLALQTVNDLPGSLVQMRRALRPDGLFLACLFAGSTLAELRAAWLAAESEITGGASPRVTPFAEIQDLGGLLQRAGFALPVIDSDRMVVRYQGAHALMREIKALGLSNALAGRSRRPVTRALLARAAAAYEERFSDPDGKVRATIEVVWLTAWAPDPSQPKPLKPGSAKARLADALNTTETRFPIASSEGKVE